MTPTREQRQFAAAIHDLLSNADTPAVARAWARGEHEPGLTLWRKLAKLGVTALAIPEEADGLGARPLDLVVAFEELGHHAVPGPLIESIVVAPTMLASGIGYTASIAARGRDGTPEASALLRQLASGEAIATVGPLFLDADIASFVLGGTPGDLAIGIDRTRRLFPGSSDAAISDAGALACAAQLLGAGRAMLEMSVEYAKQRVQFGQPIGRFQAIKHKLADVFIALEFARPLLYAAASSYEPRDISAAKVACSDAAYLAARAALQVHGAIGYTEEFDLSLWFTKVRDLIPAWGTPAEHRARVMAAL
ncbi:MAG TPA: acyl-CoA dehydrogenase [Micromonosporaceae bacterium]|nr:acyl-CoA dehydrogenase [Micromonosporaceae bacterium]HCU50659.1 acyl-CoA dehydrogenase [Micromonosporaceae bacterium]